MIVYNIYKLKQVNEHMYISIRKHAKERKKNDCPKPAKYKAVRKASTSLTIPQRSRHLLTTLPRGGSYRFVFGLELPPDFSGKSGNRG